MNKRKYIRRKRRTVEAYTNAPLMNVRNQLMNKLGDGFDVIGGSTVPKIIVTPNNRKDIQFEIQANGQNVEVTPVIDNIPDYIHKRKGIAFMQASNILYDFIMGMLSSFKKEDVNMKNKLTINEWAGSDKYFVGVFTEDQLDKYSDERTYEEAKTFTDRQSAWEYALKWNTKGYCIEWASSEMVGYGYPGDNDYYEEEQTDEYDYAPYEMEEYFNSMTESYNDTVFTQKSYDTFKEFGFVDKGNYWIKDYIDCTIQVDKSQGRVTAYEDGNVIYCPIKYVQSFDEIEELDNWGEFGGF